MINEQSDRSASLGSRETLRELLLEEIREQGGGSTDSEYCWWCQADVNGKHVTAQPHEPNCWYVRAAAALSCPSEGLPPKAEDKDHGLPGTTVPGNQNDPPSTLRQPANPNAREWLIYNGSNGQFWGPDRGGYFGLWGAGLYTEAEARDLASNRDRLDRVHHISEYRDQIANMRWAFERLNDALVRADYNRGIRCMDFSPPWFRGHWRDWHRGHRCHLDDGKPRRPQAVAEIEAHLASGVDGGASGDTHV